MVLLQVEPLHKVPSPFHRLWPKQRLGAGRGSCGYLQAHTRALATECMAV